LSSASCFISKSFEVQTVAKDPLAVNPTSQRDELAADLAELVSYIRPVFGALKRGGPMPEQFAEAFERAALGPRHVPVLMTVTLAGELGGGLSVSDLAEQLDLSLSTTSLMVGELSRAGLLERSEDESDRRRTLVRLNGAYREGASEWLQERLDPLRRTLERLTPRARANFLEGFRILAEETARIGRNADC
jgi:DNA-binding MarR family transcriptional regulator